MKYWNRKSEIVGRRTPVKPIKFLPGSGRCLRWTDHKGHHHFLMVESLADAMELCNQAMKIRASVVGDYRGNDGETQGVAEEQGPEAGSSRAGARGVSERAELVGG